MLISILSVILVSFICLCFFKKKFWENRYLVLAISVGVALIATLTTNYATRGNYETKIKTVRTENMQLMYLSDTMLTSDFALSIDEEYEGKSHLHGGDTTKVGRYSPYLFYYNDDDLKVMFYIDNKVKYGLWNNLYIYPSEDSSAYFTKQKVYYDNEPNKWVTDFSLPNIKTVRCLYLPEEHYATIPDSLIREFPTKFSLKVDWD
jgi:hypothetical protein